MKRGISPAILTGIIAIVSTLVVILIFVTPKIVELITGSGQQAGCQLSLLISTTAEKATWGFAKDVPVECKTERKTITQNDLAKYASFASKATSLYPSDSVAAKEFPNTQEGKDKWALANIVANDMKKCYDRGWKGQINLGSVPGIKGVIGGAMDTLGTDYLCILCTRYTFDSKVSAIQSFPIQPWLEQNVVQERTFYDYLMNGSDDVFAKTNLARSYVKTNEPLAVLFVADSKGQGGVLATSYSSLTKKFGEAIIFTNILGTESEMKRQYGDDVYYVGSTAIDKDASSWVRSFIAGGPVGIVLNIFDANPVNIVYGWRVPVKCHTIIGD